MNHLMNKLYLNLVFGLGRAKKKSKEVMNHFLNEEKGAAEIIAMIVIIGVVLVIAFVFRKAIGDLFTSLWNTLVKGDKSGESKNDSFSVGDVPDLGG